jgi:hypothetical protein
MRKASINMLLLLSNVYDKRDLTNLHKDLKGVSDVALEAILTRLEAQKVVAVSAISDEIEREAKRIAEEIEQARQRREAAAGTVTEITHLLLTRYKLKPPVAAQRLSDQLARSGYRASVGEVPTTKASFSKWVAELCEKAPREQLMDSALSLRPPS